MLVMTSNTGRSVAAIDIGTNSVLMLVARINNDSSLEIARDLAATTRLGQGLEHSPDLRRSAIERTLEALRGFACIAADFGTRPVAVGTGALRLARNAAEFLAAAERILGTPVEVITGPREAELTYRGAVHGLPRLGDEVTVVDVGGGTTEVARGRGGRLLETSSLRLGAVGLTEKHELEAPVTPVQILAIVSEIDAALQHSGARLAPPLIAVGGTATTLAAIINEVEPYDPARIHGITVSTLDIDETCRRLERMSIAERVHVKGLEPARADIIVTGALILKEIAEFAGTNEITVSNGGVRYGLAVEMAGRNPIDSAPIST